MNMRKIFLKFSLLASVIGLSMSVHAAGSSFTLDSNIDIKDTISKQRGAQT